MNRNLLGLTALALAFAANLAAADVHRSTGGAAPQAQGDTLYARGTGSVTPSAIDMELYERGTCGISPQSQPR